LSNGNSNESKRIHFDLYDDCYARLEERLMKEHNLEESDALDEDLLKILRDSKIVKHVNVMEVDLLELVQLTCDCCKNLYSFPRVEFDKAFDAYKSTTKK